MIKHKKEKIMHIHKFWHWILNFIAILLIFAAGFVIGLWDNANASKITITSQCTGIGVSKSFSSNYESINGRVIKDEQTKSETYTTRCLCFASDRTHKNIWVDSVEISGKSADDVRTQCDNTCQTLCEEHLAEFSFDNYTK